MSESDPKRQKYVAMGYPVGTAVPSGIPESELETGPEVSAKRTAEMQQLANSPFEGKLTIIWETEKAELLTRLSNLEAHAVDQDKKICAVDLDVKDLQTKLQKLLEAYRTYGLIHPPLESSESRGTMHEIPLSEHPLYKKSD